MAGVHSHLATISEAEILKIREDAVPENTKKATKRVVEITEWVRIYLKQLFFSILGWKQQNIYLAALQLSKYSAAIHLDFKE